MSFGHWTSVESLRAFEYTVDQEHYPPARWDPVIGEPTTRHWIHLGNRRITLVADNQGLFGLWDSHDGYLWITEPRPAGTGVSRLVASDGVIMASTSYLERGNGPLPLRWFGPTFARVTTTGDGVRLERTVLCPAGEQPWVLVRVAVTSLSTQTQRLTLIEEWLAKPATVDIQTPGRTPVVLDPATVTSTDHGVWIGPLPQGAPCAGSVVVLDRLDDGPARAEPAGSDTPRLALAVDLELAPGAEQVVFFRFGLADDRSDDQPAPAPAELYRQSLRSTASRTPTAHADRAPEAARELGWHAALLTGGASTDGVLGGHTLDQGSVYAFGAGFNGAARDPLQHALPLVYLEPELALSVLRNTCAWGSPDGDLPYGLDGRKQPWTEMFRPSDANLWALWLAAEYVAATGDLASLRGPVNYHPRHQADSVPLAEHLRRQFEFFVHGVGRGRRGHVRMLNADWNDLALAESGVDRAVMIEHGESVLNSAMAAWVLPVYAGLAERLGQHDTARSARALAGELREAVAGEWTGRWFRRAHAPGAEPVGEHDLWLEVQPWAILCGAASPDQAEQLLATIDAATRADSPLGARIRGPVAPRSAGDDLAMRGSIWYSINMTLVWAAARLDADLAWDEWRRMTLSAHSTAYPDIWEGTLSGPDSYLSPETSRPGRTWASPELGLAMQSYPVSNLHCHSQPLLAYLRLLGVEPTGAGELRVGTGGSFASPVLTVRPDGTGRLDTIGEVTVTTEAGNKITGSGTLRW
jgi:hypothetical protein